MFSSSADLKHRGEKGTVRPMQLFTGIDLVELIQMQHCLRHPRFLDRVFSPEEQLLFQQKGSRSLATIAANFAAKEAFSKSLGTGVRGFSLREVGVLRDGLGAPFLSLSGHAAQIAHTRGLSFSVSMTHTDHYAAAVVVAIAIADATPT